MKNSNKKRCTLKNLSSFYICQVFLARVDFFKFETLCFLESQIVKHLKFPLFDNLLQ